ncbi:L-2,4-diaminobutyrate decarboxylase [Neolewinella maritima]|uniref:L-2,4-diaminobutyrate decarboxylase n=1 Tax=Neolewinella maritima TaxID=1383882 RepID=A0ABN8EZR9_9BACT|nr:pyridoxal-dependent decarboxylase [Neolewinella maritima]CAH0999422.1 L-2,4-diaminobutyrate decarboxylase [Neolewinella maritima]
MTELLRRAYDPASFRTQGHALIDQLADYLEGVTDHPANPYATPQDSLSVWRSLLERGAAPEEVYRQLLTDNVHLHHPGYMGHQVVPPAPLTALGDVAASLMNAGQAVFEMGRPGAAMEQVVIERFAELLRLAPTTGGFLTSGGTLANLTALLAARARQWPAGSDAWQDGNATVRPCLLVNAQAHYCIDRAVRIMGWGAEGIIHVPADGELRMRTELIDGLVADARARGLTPIALVGSACTTSTGTYDNLSALADAAERHRLWLHIDGAHGAAVRLDPGRQQLTEGLERADSLTLDFHKMLMTPALTTGLFFREGGDAYRTFQQEADYLLGRSGAAEDDWSDNARRTFECTKRTLSLRVFTLLTTYGPEVFRDYVVQVGALGRTLAGLVRRHPNLELFMEPDVNIVCFRFVDAALPAAQRSAVNTLIRATLTEDGTYYIVQTKIAAQTYLRCTLTNAFTTERQLADMLARVVDTGQQLLSLRAALPL